MIPRAKSLALQSASIPDFLLPAFVTAPPKRVFSHTSKCQSRIGAAPLSIPPEVKLQFLEAPTPKSHISPRRFEPPRVLNVQGPLGKMKVEIPSYMQLNQDHQTKKATLSIEDKSERKQREMWGTTRALLNNHILGVSEGHTAILRLVGVGYRASVEPKAITKQPAYPGQQFVALKVGYSHPIELGVPEGMKASTPQPTRILLEGPDRETVMQFAAEIKLWRRPEPYKGKGIFVNGETIRLKAKKIK